MKNKGKNNLAHFGYQPGRKQNLKEGTQPKTSGTVPKPKGTAPSAQKPQGSQGNV